MEFKKDSKTKKGKEKESMDRLWKDSNREKIVVMGWGRKTGIKAEGRKYGRR